LIISPPRGTFLSLYFFEFIFKWGHENVKALIATLSLVGVLNNTIRSLPIIIKSIAETFKRFFLDKFHFPKKKKRIKEQRRQINEEEEEETEYSIVCLVPLHFMNEIGRKFLDCLRQYHTAEERNCI
jgi:hypothetical protein